MPPMPVESKSFDDNSSGTSQTAIFGRSNVKIVLTGETKEEAEAAYAAPITLPRMPTFSSVVAEREHIKQQLAIGFRLFAKYGFDEGVAGHMTARDPEYPNLFWVNPFGMHFGQIRPSDLILCDHEGNLVRGNRAVNKAAFVIHSKVHEARPDAIAACHTHSLYGRTFSTLGRKLLPVTQDACAFYEDHGLYDDFKGVVLASEEGEKIGKALGQNKAVILQNHGLLTVGKTVEEAVWWFISMERCCQSQLVAEAASNDGVNGLLLIDPASAKQTYETIGTPLAGWFMAQPMYEMILKDSPDLSNK